MNVCFEMFFKKYCYFIWKNKIENIITVYGSLK